MEYQAIVLKRLQGIRDALVGEIGEVTSMQSAKETAEKECEELRKQNERLKYRVQILIRSLEREEKLNASLKSDVS
jgi:hypothetical protein